MYLSRVEMTGFKSFADKTVIEFDQGLTAVVGPNGSGKSNLSEAIRWVLGEQSAKSLRGNRMEDVIFNGTPHRKPVNLAKVTLILNNEDRYLDLDFSEISISRSYHRNGDSHYAINNEPCRLKDIVDLLLDSGLGKNSFSIISQGQVEQIFLNKPEERRTIFEEAAGVQKYQYRKSEAQRKLLRSQDHLSRVRDIIHELKLQHAPLKKQRESALTYQNLKSQLKGQEVALYAYQIDQSKQAWDKSQERLTIVETQLLKDKNQEESLNTTILQHKQAYQSLINSIDQQTSQQQSLMQTIENHKSQIAVLEQQLGFHESSSKEKQQAFENQEQEISHLQKNLEALQSEIKMQEGEKEKLKAKLKDLQTLRQEIDQLSGAKLEEVRSEIIEVYQAQASAKNQLQHNECQIDLLADRLGQTQDKLQDLQGKQVDLSQIYQDAQEHQVLVKESLRHAQKKLQDTHEQYRDLQAQEQGVKTQLFELEREVNRIHQQLEGLKQHQEEYVGYYPGVRHIMKHAQKISGIHQPLAELLRVDKQYQIAIDIALGASSQHIVVDNDQAAKDAIQLLRQAKAGRATFLPLTNIQGRQLGQQLSNLAQAGKGFIGFAVDLVKYDATYQAIASNALATTVVVDTIDHAQTLAKSSRFKLKIVTLDGDLLMPGGSITGGRQKQQGKSMLSRQDERNQLQSQYQTKSQLLSDLDANYQTIQSNLAQYQEDIQDQRQEIRGKEQAYQDAQTQLGLAQQAQGHDQQQVVIFQEDIQEMQGQIQVYQEEKASLEEKLHKFDVQIQGLQSQLEQVNVSEEDRQNQIAEIDQKIQSTNTHAEVLKVTLNQNLKKREELQAELDKRQRWIQDYHQQVSSTELSMEDIQIKIDQHLKDLDQTQKEAFKLKETIDTNRQERAKIQEEVTLSEEQIHHLQYQIQEAIQEVAKLEANIDKHQSFIDNYLAYLSEEYQLSYEAAVEDSQEITSVKQVKQEVNEIKRKIDKLGPINLQAIEDFEELDERYQTLVEQENDLLEAMNQLQETMDEMDDEVISRFGQTFDQINEQFQLSFKKLFGGGQAALELTEPDDLLTTGIDIIAQPPGKRKQNLALLSGGERALTAIALLFAILETRPVPFVVLDEVEAALDDANVYRYGEYIQTFTQQTQFIVITHRKGTMEHADVLYGVTMQQSGISKLASVRLTEAVESTESSSQPS